MRIQHNITAMNSYRNFSANNSNLSKNLEKLSSGYKINRAGDDAAGLAISEKMRAQITGLEGATKNSKDGISLIQTAEGALTEVHDMLNRMTTLAEQSANGTYQNELDREQLQKEVQALKDEIDRIADSTNFNGLKLLDGSLSENTAAVNNETQLMTVKGSIAATGSAVNAKFVDATGDSYAVTTGLTNNAAYGAIKIGFTTADGTDYDLTLVSDNVGSSSFATDSALADALNGKTAGLTLTEANGKDPAKALKAFRDTFTVAAPTTAGTGGELTFTVKGDAVGAKLNSIMAGTGTAAAAASGATAKGLTKTEGMGAGYELELDIASNAAAADNDTVSIGDKVYEFVTSSSTAIKTAGATAVMKGADEDASVTNLYNALKDDGYTVTLDKTGGTGKYKIRFTDLEDISEAQSGGSASVSSSNLAVQDQEASKQKVEFTAAAATSNSATYNLTVAYVDADGNNKSKTISYKDEAGTPSATTTGAVIADALKSDDDINGMFDIAVSAGKVTMTAKSTDNSVGQLSAISTSDTAGIGTVKYTAGVNDGKAIELKDNTANIKAGDTVTVNGKTYEFAASGSSSIGEGNVRVLVGSNGKDSMKNLSAAMTDNGILNSYDAASGKVVMRDTDNVLEQTTGGLSLQIGDTADAFNKLTVSVNDMHSGAIGVGDVDISTQQGASDALDKIKAAINNVSDTRGTLGALQNRLEHTINNLGVQRENIQNAESLIRDTDVAEEMMAYTKNNILNQSAQAMLAQANQLPQGVLQLLG